MERRISEAPTDGVRDLVGGNLEIFDAEPEATEPGEKPEAASPESADAHQERLMERILRIVRPPVQNGLPVQVETETGPAAEPQYHGVRLTKVALRRKEKFKLVVVLYEPFDPDVEVPRQVEIDKTVVRGGRLGNGEIEDEKKRAKVTVPRVAGSLAVLLFVALIVSLLIGPSARRPALQCAAGPLRIIGSSVFLPVVDPIADQYSDACDDGPRITTDVTGSKKGLLELVGPEVRPAELALVHDGDATATQDLDKHPVAVSIYSIAVNESVSALGLKGLTSEDLRKIWTGEYRFWDEVPGVTATGQPGLPIRIVSRGAESGSRAIFEDSILKATEGALTSDDCEHRKATLPETSVIRCERDDNKLAITEIGTIEGAIGYVDIPPTNAERKSRMVVPVALDDLYPDISNIQRSSDKGYHFWTIENLYTRGAPADGSRLGYFLDHLASAEGGRQIQSAGYIPCVNADGTYHQLCQ